MTPLHPTHLPNLPLQLLVRAILTPSCLIVCSCLQSVSPDPLSVLLCIYTLHASHSLSDHFRCCCQWHHKVLFLSCSVWSAVFIIPAIFILTPQYTTLHFACDCVWVLVAKQIYETPLHSTLLVIPLYKASPSFLICSSSIHYTTLLLFHPSLCFFKTTFNDSSCSSPLFHQQSEDSPD